MKTRGQVFASAMARTSCSVTAMRLRSRTARRAGRPPAAHQRFARQIHHGVAALDRRDQPAGRRVGVNQFDLGTQEAPGARRRSHPRDDGMPVALEPRNQRPTDETGRARHEHTHVTPFLDLSAVVRPVKDGLSLPPPTFEIARFAVLPNRRHVPGDRTPASNLPGIVGGSAAHVVAAIPLKPPARILRVDPAAAAPDAERLRGVHAEIVQARVVPLGAQLGASEPAPRETPPGSPSCTSRRRRRAAASLSASDPA